MANQDMAFEEALHYLAEVGERFLYLRHEYEASGKIHSGEYTNVPYSVLWAIYDYVHQREEES